MRPPIFFGNAGATTASVVAFWVLFYIWAGSEIWLAYRRRRRNTEATDQDSGTKWLLIASVWSSTALGIGLAFGFPDAAIKNARAVVFITGLALMVGGMGLRWYSIWNLGSSFTCDVATRPGQQVVETGPYRWIRHPSYAGSLCTILGVLLCCDNYVSLAALALAATAYAYRIRVEERVLLTDLGPAYREYMRRTRRLIPFVI